MTPKEWVLLTALVLSSIWDISLYIIPNELLAAAFIIGFTLNPAPGFILRAVMIIAIGRPFAKKKFLGGGDVKLYAIICAYLGIREFITVFILSVFAAGIPALIILIRKKSGKIPMAAMMLVGYLLTLI
ncbi:MAG: prepilin peptidase [Lachnospiraceae bacterium]|nr:prepilin peptidase [Candidatus Minthocola equi]